MRSSIRVLCLLSVVFPLVACSGTLRPLPPTTSYSGQTTGTHVLTGKKIAVMGALSLAKVQQVDPKAFAEKQQTAAARHVAGNAPYFLTISAQFPYIMADVAPWSTGNGSYSATASMSLETLLRNNDLARDMARSEGTEYYSLMLLPKGPIDLTTLDLALTSGAITPEEYSRCINEMLVHQEIATTVQKEYFGEIGDGLSLIGRSIANPATGEAIIFWDGVYGAAKERFSDFNFMMRHGTLIDSLIAKYDSYVERLTSDDPYIRERASLEGGVLFATTFSGVGVGGKLLLPTGSVAVKGGVEVGSAAAISAAERAGGTAGVKAAESAAVHSSAVAGQAVMGEAGSLVGANFAQKTVSNAFSPKGAELYSQLAGRPITTIDDLADALRAGVVKPSQIPVDYVNLGAGRLILNTRTSTALERAGIPRSEWIGIDRTGQNVPGLTSSTYDDLARGQLSRNKLPDSGISTIRQR